MGEARSAGLVEVRRWISPSAGLKGPTTTIPCSRNCRQKMDKPECGIERALTPAKMPKVHLVRRWISPSAGLKALHKTHNQRARTVRRWISPSAGLKDPSPRWVPSTGERQKMDKPECGIERNILNVGRASKI